LRTPASGRLPNVQTSGGPPTLKLPKTAEYFRGLPFSRRRSRPLLFLFLFFLFFLFSSLLLLRFPFLFLLDGVPRAG
jgi:hypothetical protein